MAGSDRKSSVSHATTAQAIGEFWDAHGTPPTSKGKIRRFIDVGRLTKGR